MRNGRLVFVAGSEELAKKYGENFRHEQVGFYGKPNKRNAGISSVELMIRQQAHSLKTYDKFFVPDELITPTGRDFVVRPVSINGDFRETWGIFLDGHDALAGYAWNRNSALSKVSDAPFSAKSVRIVRNEKPVEITLY